MTDVLVSRFDSCKINVFMAALLQKKMGKWTRKSAENDDSSKIKPCVLFTGYTAIKWVAAIDPFSQKTLGLEHRMGDDVHQSEKNDLDSVWVMCPGAEFLF